MCNLPDSEPMDCRSRSTPAALNSHEPGVGARHRSLTERLEAVVLIKCYRDGARTRGAGFAGTSRLT